MGTCFLRGKERAAYIVDCHVLIIHPHQLDLPGCDIAGAELMVIQNMQLGEWGAIRNEKMNLPVPYLNMI